MHADATERADRARRRVLRGTHARLFALFVTTLALSLAAAVTGCGGESGGGSKITVFAAASLTEAFSAMGDEYAAAHPGTRVVLNLAGSQDLAAQLEQGAAGDVLATADMESMVRVASLVSGPRVFAGNRLAIAVAPGNPMGIGTLADLADARLKVVVAAPEVPAGKYARRVLESAGVTLQPVSFEGSVKGVVTKVSLGEADAGLVYVTDIAAAEGKVDAVRIVDAGNVLATYPIAAVRGSERPVEAQAFIDLVMSARGQAVLKRFGFLPARAE